MALFGINEQFSNINIKKFCYLSQSFQIGLNGIGTPLGDRRRVFAKLLRKPFSLPPAFGKHSLDPIEFNDFHFQ